MPETVLTTVLTWLTHHQGLPVPGPASVEAAPPRIIMVSIPMIALVLRVCLRTWAPPWPLRNPIRATPMVVTARAASRPADPRASPTTPIMLSRGRPRV